MGTDTSQVQTPQGLAIIEQVAYNTTYNIDFQKDGDSQPNIVYKAAGVSVSPGSYESDDAGVCSNTGAQTFTVNGTGDKSGLSFRITNQCSAYLQTTDRYKYRIRGGSNLVAEQPPAYGVGADGETRIEVYNTDDFTIRWQWISPETTYVDGNLVVVKPGYWTAKSNLETPIVTGKRQFIGSDSFGT